MTDLDETTSKARPDFHRYGGKVRVWVDRVSNLDTIAVYIVRYERRHRSMTSKVDAIRHAEGRPISEMWRSEYLSPNGWVEYDTNNPNDRVEPVVSFNGTELVGGAMDGLLDEVRAAVAAVVPTITVDES